MKLYRILYEDFREMYLSYATLAIILNSCVGAGAAMAVLMVGHETAQMIQLFLVVAGCMWYNTTFFAHLGPKVVFNSLVASMLLSVVVILYNMWILIQ